MGVQTRVHVNAASALAAFLATLLLVAPPLPAAEPAPDPVRILYLDGELRSETKFLRRALETDHRFLFGSIVLTRGEPDRAAFSADDVSTEALQGLDVLILGSVARTDFSDDQVEAIVSWVKEGGNLLLLGGRRALAHGDWKDSPLDPLLPIEPMSKTEVIATISVPATAAGQPTNASRVNAEIEALKAEQQRLKEQFERRQRAQGATTEQADDRSPEEIRRAEIRRKQQELRRRMEAVSRSAGGGRERTAPNSSPETPEPAGDLMSLRPRLVENSYRELHLEPEPSAYEHPALAFEEGAANFFVGLPALATHQLEARARDETTVLLRAVDDPSFAALSYAERSQGFCVVLAATDTWRWQMHANIEPDDTKHERLWTQLIRWLARESSSGS